MTNTFKRFTPVPMVPVIIAGFLLLATQVHAQLIPKPITAAVGTGIIQWDFDGDGEFDTESLVRRSQDGDLTAGEIRIPVMENGTITVQEFGTGLGSWARFQESGTVLLQTLHRNRAGDPTPYRFLAILAEFKLPRSRSTEGGSSDPIPGLAFIAAFPSVEALVNQNPSLTATVNVQGHLLAFKCEVNGC